MKYLYAQWKSLGQRLKELGPPCFSVARGLNSCYLGSGREQIMAFASPETPEPPPRSAGAEQHPHQLLQADVRLSDSLLWQLQENHFSSKGISAWDAVPYYITNNPYIAETYAELIMAFLLDCYDSLNQEEPLYIVEVAAGTACFSFYFIKELLLKKQYYQRLKGLKFCYVVTDFVEPNVVFAEQNTQFAPYLEAGVIDFALFRPDCETSLHLRAQDRELNSHTITNPLIVVANYFFDSIRQDMFRVKDGKLQEARFSFYRETAETQEADPFSQLVFTFDYKDADINYYDEPAFNNILRYYTEHLPCGSILLPIAGLESLRLLFNLSNRNMVLLSSDKGFTDMSFMKRQEGYNYTIQGAISYMVNYDAIRHYFEQQDGCLLHTTNQGLSVNTIMGFLLRHRNYDLEHCRYFFQERLIHQDSINSPYDCQALFDSQELDGQQMLKSCIALIRLCNYDPIVLAKCAGKINQSLPAMDVASTDELISILDRVSLNFYADKYHYNASFWMGRLYHCLHQLPKAIGCYSRCINMNQTLPYAYFNLGLVQQEMRSNFAAVKMFETYLKLAPEADNADQVRQRIDQLRRLGDAAPAP